MSHLENPTQKLYAFDKATPFIASPVNKRQITRCIVSENSLTVQHIDEQVGHPFWWKDRAQYFSSAFGSAHPDQVFDCAPDAPGVYAFIGSGALLYIGRSRNLRARLFNHDKWHRLLQQENALVSWYAEGHADSPYVGYPCRDCVHVLEAYLIYLYTPVWNHYKCVDSGFSKDVSEYRAMISRELWNRHAQKCSWQYLPTPSPS